MKLVQTFHRNCFFARVQAPAACSSIARSPASGFGVWRGNRARGRASRAPKHGYRTQTPNPDAGSLRLRDPNPTRLPALNPKITKRSGGVRMKAIQPISKNQLSTSYNEIKNNEISWQLAEAFNKNPPMLCGSLVCSIKKYFQRRCEKCRYPTQNCYKQCRKK